MEYIWFALFIICKDEYYENYGFISITHNIVTHLGKVFDLDIVWNVLYLAVGSFHLCTVTHLVKVFDLDIVV